MFQVSPAAVKKLYRAQHADLRGKLRLDISSRCYPPDPTIPVNLRCAQQAIGERLVQLMLGCAGDVRMLAQHVELDGEGRVVTTGWGRPDQDTALMQFVRASMLSLDRAGERLPVTSGPRSFEPFVIHRINENFGLDGASHGYAEAVAQLAGEFSQWVDEDGSDAGDYGLTSQPPRTYIACHPLSPEFVTDHEPAEDFLIPIEVEEGRAATSLPPVEDAPGEVTGWWDEGLQSASAGG